MDLLQMIQKVARRVDTCHVTDHGGLDHRKQRRQDLLYSAKERESKFETGMISFVIQYRTVVLWTSLEAGQLTTYQTFAIKPKSLDPSVQSLTAIKRNQKTESLI